MLKNYLKNIFRNLWRHRVFSFINIMGLTVGMTAFFLIFLYVKFELSCDSFHSKKAEQGYIGLCNFDIKTPTETIYSNGPAWAVAPHVKQDFPEIESSVRIDNTSLLPCARAI